MTNTCEPCRYYMASPLQEPCESCHWDGVIGHDPPNWKGATNYDRIRAMSVEEMAELLTDVGVRTLRLHRLPVAEPVIEQAKEDWLNWLKQEASE